MTCILIVLCSLERLHAAEDDLRERLTEREDKRRPAQPWSTNIAGQPLTASGEYEIGLDLLHPDAFGDGARRRTRLQLGQSLEGELFYSVGTALSMFAQLRVVSEQNLLPNTPDNPSSRFVERGEAWLHSDHIAGSAINLDVGRLHFEDDRRWWWDNELDAVRVEYARSKLEVMLAFAHELGPRRSDHHFVDPEHDGIDRVIAEIGWDYRADHVLNLFLLHHRDRSALEQPGQIVRSEREDRSDARLTWLGGRMMGAFPLPGRLSLGYWLDTALVRGRERVIHYEAISRQQSVVDKFADRRVRGHAVDLGVNLALRTSWEPRLFAGYAAGSGDRNPESGVDGSFRQSGIHANESGFGGVRRFANYGLTLQPELSNLRIQTLGAGLSLLNSSSLDFVYHRYRLSGAARSLRDSKLDAPLDGQHLNVGTELDVVLALEEWKQFEFEFGVGIFRAGRAFGNEEGRRTYRGTLAVRIAF